MITLMRPLAYFHGPPSVLDVCHLHTVFKKLFRTETFFKHPTNHTRQSHQQLKLLQESRGLKASFPQATLKCTREPTSFESNFALNDINPIRHKWQHLGCCSVTSLLLSELCLAIFIWPIFILGWQFKYYLCSLTVDSSTVTQPQAPGGQAAFENRNILLIWSYMLLHAVIKWTLILCTALAGPGVLLGHKWLFLQLWNPQAE